MFCPDPFVQRFPKTLVKTQFPFIQKNRIEQLYRMQPILESSESSTL